MSRRREHPIMGALWCTLFVMSVTLSVAFAWWHHRLLIWILEELALTALLCALTFGYGFAKRMRQYRRKGRS